MANGQLDYYNCQLCDFGHKNRSALRNHYKKEHDEILCRCGACCNPVNTYGNFCRDPCSAGNCCCGRWG